MVPLIGNRGKLKSYKFYKDEKGYYCQSGLDKTYCVKCLFKNNCEFKEEQCNNQAEKTADQALNVLSVK